MELLNQVAIRGRVGLLFRGCSCSSVTARSTRRCSCVKKGVKCGHGCRCKNCSNSVIPVASAPGTQQESPIELVEVEEEELLHDSVLRDAYGEECVQGGGGDDDEFFDSERAGSDDEEGVEEEEDLDEDYA